MKKLLSVIAVILAVLTLAACAGLKGDGQRQYSSNGLTVTMEKGFREEEAEDYTVCFAKDDFVVFALREGFDEAAGFGDITLDEYAEFVLASNGLEKPIQSGDGFKYFEFENTVTEDGETFRYNYIACCYRAANAFWLVQFSCPRSKYDEARSKMLEWASTVTFND